MPSSWLRTQRTVFLVVARAQCVFLTRDECVFGTYRLFLKVLASFLNCYCPIGALHMCESHVESLCAVQGLWCTRVSAPLFRLLHFQILLSLVQRVSAVFLLVGSCFLDPALSRTVSMWLCLHWVQSSTGGRWSFSSKASPPLLPCHTYFHPA